MRGWRFYVGCYLVCSIVSSPAFSANDTQKILPLPEIVAADPNWDWMRLTSGEWLKGEILGLERDDFEFDSDELGDLTFDWDDVDAIYSKQPMAVLLIRGDTAVGRLQSHNGYLYIDGHNEPISHDDILAIAVSAPREIDLWQGDVSAGLALRSGNVEQRDIDVSSRFIRRTAQTTLRLNYTGNYTENDAIESANDHRATSTVDYRLNSNWFLRPLRAEYYRDEFQNIDSQWHLGVGASYYIVENTKTLWTVSAGPGYQQTNYIEVPDDEDRKVTYGVFVISTEYDQELTSSIDVYAAYDATVAKEDAGGLVQHLTLTLDVDFIGDLDLRIAAYYDHTESPQPDADGIRPDKSDIRLVVGVSYDL